MQQFSAALTLQHMPKFIIADSGLRDLLGHSYEYNVSTSEAARRRGLTPVLLAHRKFATRLTPPDIQIVPTFSSGWADFDVLTRLVLVSGGLFYIVLFSFRRLAGRLLRAIRRPFSWMATGLWWLLRPIAALRHKPPTLIILVLFAAKLALQVKLIRFLVRSLVYVPLKALLRAYRWSRRLARSAVRLLRSLPRFGVRAMVAVTRRIRRRMQGVAALLAAVLALLGKPPRAWRLELAAGLEKVAAGPEDHVFIHTISVREVDELMSFFQEREVETLPHFHVLLRRDFEEPFIRYAPGIGLPRLLEWFHGTRLWPGMISFYTDTEELTQQHDRLSRIKFVTAPIPFRHELIRQSGRERRSDEPLNVVCLGDARPEKGYQYLPNVVERLYDAYVVPGKLRFTLHSYMQPTNVPEILPHVERLRRYPDAQVRLIHGQLSPEQYYGELAEADIVLVPYQAEAYLRRSSGVVNEALAAGKPTVVPSRTWMQFQVDEDRGTWFSDPGELSQALAKIADSYESYSEAAKAFVPTWRDRHSPDRLVACLLDTADVHRATGARHHAERVNVLFIQEGDYMLSAGGSATVARQLLRFLSECGYSVYGAFPVGTHIGGRNPVHLHRNLAEASERTLRGLPMRRFWSLRFEFGWRNLWKSYQLYRDAWKNVHSLPADVGIRQALVVPKDLQDAIRRIGIDVVIINYIFNLPIVQLLGIDQVPVVCVTYDLLSHQRAAEAKRAVNPDEVDFELDLLGKVDAALFNNKSEFELVSQKLDPQKISYVPFSVTTKRLEPSLLKSCRELRDVVAQAGLEDRSKVAEHRVRTRVAERIQRAGTMDLLLVGTNHPPNIDGARWFYHQVFAPYLRPRGVSFFVAGHIWQGIQSDIGNDPNVYLLGPVDSLEPLYAATKLVVVPVLEGAGTAIKTIEALAYAKPVVTTPMGMRGMDFEPMDFPVFEDPKAFAERILQLLASPDLRLSVSRAGHAIYKAHHSPEVVHAKLHAVLQSVLGGRTLPPVVGAEESSDVSICEWSPALGALNVLLNSFLGKDETPDRVSQSRRVLREANSDGAWIRAPFESRIRELTEQELWDRDADPRSTSFDEFLEFVGGRRQGLARGA